MVKVQLPKVEEETRSELNQIKARRNDKTLGDSLNYLIDLDKNKLDLTYDELDIIITTLQEYNYEDIQNGCIGVEELRNCKSGAMKLKTVMENMKDEKGVD